MKKIYVALLPLFLLIGFIFGWWVFDTKREKKELHLVAIDIAKTSNNLLLLRDIIASAQNIDAYEEVLILQLMESTNILGHLLMQNELELEEVDRELLSSVFQVTPELNTRALTSLNSREDLGGIKYVKDVIESRGHTP
jgi:hypothetical protein